MPSLSKVQQFNGEVDDGGVHDSHDVDHVGDDDGGVPFVCDQGGILQEEAVGDEGGHVVVGGQGEENRHGEGVDDDGESEVHGDGDHAFLSCDNDGASLVVDE